MKTNDLIDLLSTQAGPAPQLHLAKRFTWAGLLGGAAAALMAVGAMGFIPAEMLSETAPWLKLVYAVLLTLAAAMLMTKLGRPGANVWHAGVAVFLIVALMVGVGALAYLMLDPAERAASLMGHSWQVCAIAILVLSTPVMLGSFWVMKGLAPVHQAKAGAACGLFAGAVAAMAYSLACTESATPFIALWYTAGISLASATGALLGPRLLRW